MFVGIAFKLVAGLAGLLLIMRLLGKKTLSEITPFDLIYTLVLGGIIEESIYDDMVHVGHILFALVVWGTLIYIVEVFVQKNDKINRTVKGKPSVLVLDGKLDLEELEKNHMEMEQLRTLLRTANCFSLQEAKHAILETGGEISVMKNNEIVSALSILLIDEGHVEKATLQSIGKDEAWLLDELTKVGKETPKDIIYAEWSEENGLYAVPYSETIRHMARIDD